MSRGAISLEREPTPLNGDDVSDTPANNESALDRLAGRCGIQPSGQDGSGNVRETSPELKRALLRAMRFQVDDEEQAAATLHELDAREWGRALPPVHVAYAAAGPISIPVIVPADAQQVRWTLRLEDGSTQSGVERAQDLPLLEERNQGSAVLHRRTLTLQISPPWGYHQLTLDGLAGRTTLIVTPGKCWLPTEEQDTRFWGFALSLFVLRTSKNWGIGDFTDLRDLVHLTKSQGADVLGLNPLHAMFLDQPEDASPYSPSDRTLLNVLYIDVQAVPELESSDEAQALVASPEFQRELESARNASLVQYEKVAHLKLSTLRVLFQEFQARKDSARHEAFSAFLQERGPKFQQACTFQALRDFFSAQDSARGDCSQWPEEYRSTRSPAVEAFAQEHADLVSFHLWLQWIADTQLKAAADAAQGMAVGLYRDLAVGAHPSGAEIWSHPDELVSGAQIGAPPDPLGPSGQNWGLPPLHPLAAREHAYSSFISLLRANMRYAGGLRMDHAMALQRLYWVPKGMEAKDGTYVQYQREELIGILALESQRHQCLVVGEDLGTVPEGFRDRMAEANILSYRVLFFEREEDEFLTPEQYPRLALSVASNHDLPTLKGWWQGSDIDLKDRLGLFPDGPESARTERKENREALITLFREKGLLEQDGEVEGAAFSRAAHEFLARTSTLLTLVQLDDITEEEVQVNVPGTSSENPNWRRRLALTLEDLAADPRLGRIASMMSEERNPSRATSSPR